MKNQPLMIPSGGGETIAILKVSALGYTAVYDPCADTWTGKGVNTLALLLNTLTKFGKSEFGYSDPAARAAEAIVYAYNGRAVGPADLIREIYERKEAVRFLSMVRKWVSLDV